MSFNSPIDTAYVEIKPDTGRFIPDLQRQLNGALGHIERTASQSLGGVSKQFDKMGKGAQESFQGIAKSADREFKKVDVAAQTNAREAGSHFSGLFGTVLKRGAQVAGAAVAGVMTAALVKGFGRLTAIDDARAKLTGLGHDAKTVQKIMDNAMASVKGTAFGFGEAASLSASMVAAGIKPGKELERILKLVGDSATIAGTDLMEMGAIWGKVAATGRLQGDEMQQLTERGIPILQLLAKHYKVTASEAREMVSKGKVDFATFATVMESSMGGAALKSGQTFTGAMRNVGAALSRLGAGLMGGVFSQLPNLFADIIGWIDKITPAATKAGEWIGKKFKEGIVVLKEWGQTIGEAIVPRLKEMWEGAQKVWEKLEPWHGIIGKMAGYALMFLGIAGALLKIQAAAGLALGALKAMAFFAAANPWLLLIAATATAATYIITNWDDVKKKVGDVFTWMQENAGSVGPKILSAIADWAGKIGSGIRGLVTLVISGDWTKDLEKAFGWTPQSAQFIDMQFWRNNLRDNFTTIATWIRDEGMPSLGKAVGDGASALWSWVKDFTPNMIKAIGDGYAAVVTWLTTTAPQKIGEAASGLGPKLWQWIKDNAPIAITKLGEWIGTVAGWLVSDGLPAIAAAGGKMFGALLTALPTMAAMVPKLVEWVAKVGAWFVTEGIPQIKFYGTLFWASFIGAFVNEITKSDAYQAVSNWLGGLGSLLSIGWTTIAGAASIAWQNITGAIGRALATAEFAVSTVWNRITTYLKGVWDGIVLWFAQRQAIFAANWNNFWNGVGTFVSDRWNTLKANVSQAWNDLTSNLKKGWDWLNQYVFSPIKTGIDYVGRAFKNGTDFIGQQWARLQNLAKTPIKWIIDNVINRGIINGFNFLDRLLGGKHQLAPVTIAGWASGGVLPGFTPGRDVHKFVSPTGGALALSGGEGIMRPEFVRAVGGERGVRELNKMARMGKLGDKFGTDFGVGGSLLDWIKDQASTVWSWMSDKASAIWKAVSNPLQYLKERLGTWWRSVPGSGSPLVGLAQGAVDKGVGIAVDTLKGIWTEFQKAFSQFQLSAGPTTLPVPAGSPITAPYGQYSWGGRHGGIDWGVAMGTLIRAFRSGTVVRSGWDPTGYGYAIRLQHANGYQSLYAHNRNLLKKVGEVVQSGTGISYSDSTGNSTGPHLHFGISKDGAWVDPWPFLRGRSFDRGGWLQPGFNLAYNGTGRAERVVPSGEGYGPMTINLTVSIDDLAKMSKLVDFLKMLEDARVAARRTSRSGTVTA